jgi:HEAT repeat protein
MNKLVEREHAPPASPLATAPALAVQFFLIPLAVVAAVVLIYAGFRAMLADERSASAYLAEVRTASGDRRWPAAYELSRLVSDPAAQSKDPTLGPKLVQAFTDSASSPDPRVRRYLALALGRLQPPPPGAVEALLAVLNGPDDETKIAAIWALGSIGDVSVVPRLRELYRSPDAGVRKMVVFALGVLPGTEQADTLKLALGDPVPDVEWNAAVALADDGHPEAVPVLARMLDREYLARTVTRTSSLTAATDPISEVMLGGLRAAARLRSPALRGTLEQVSRTDPSLKVRQAALEALEAM